MHIAVHRATLSAASPVFDAAFSSQMSEGNTATYEIEDSTPTAVEAMLRYIYIGDSDCLPDDLAFLLDLSAQYELDDLCAEVLERMAKDLTSWQAKEIDLKDESDGSAVEMLIKVVYGGKAIVRTMDEHVHLYCLADKWQCECVLSAASAKIVSLV